VTAVVVSASPLPGPWLDTLAETFEVRIAEPERSFGAFRAELADADGLISLLTVPVDAELLAAAPRLRVVANYAVGVDNVDRAAAAARSSPARSARRAGRGRRSRAWRRA